MKNSDDSFLKIIEILEKHGVKYLIVGGYGTVLQGAPTTTKDIDFLLEQSPENYDRLASAMIELNAKYRGVEDLEVPWSGKLISSQVFGNFTCDFGDFDVIKEIPAGPGGQNLGFLELYESGIGLPLENFTIFVASIEHIVASKRAANRPKDHIMLPILEDFLANQNRSGTEAPSLPHLGEK